MAHIEMPDNIEYAKAYSRIRNAVGDVEVISEVTGVNVDVVARIKEHIFLRGREVAVGANETRMGRFTPMEHIACWWERATNGNIPDSEQEYFRRWLEHEAIESRLMEWGMPYNSSHPSNWKWDDVYEEVVYNPNVEYYGAHDVSRSEGRPGPFDHYLEGWNKPEAELSFDLSNADEIAQTIFDWYRK